MLLRLINFKNWINWLNKYLKKHIIKYLFGFFLLLFFAIFGGLFSFFAKLNLTLEKPLLFALKISSIKESKIFDNQLKFFINIRKNTFRTNLRLFIFPSFLAFFYTLFNFWCFFKNSFDTSSNPTITFNEKIFRGAANGLVTMLEKFWELGEQDFRSNDLGPKIFHTSSQSLNVLFYMRLH